MKALLQPTKTLAAAAAQRVSKPAQTIVDNRPQVAAQRKLQEVANRCVSSSVIQQAEDRRATGSAVAQRNVSKTLKNIFTLGLRKAYVNHKRNNRVNMPLVTEQAQEEGARVDLSMEAFVKAYEKSRHYHSSRNGYADSIDKSGLLIEKDRKANEDIGDIIGYSAIGGGRGEFGGDEKLGVFMSDKAHRIQYQKTYPSPAVRVYLTKEQAEKKGRMPESYENRKVPVGPGLYYDGSGGLISTISIAANQVSKKDVEDLLDDPKLSTILSAVASHYPTGTAPDHEELKSLLKQATAQDSQTKNRRLSNAQLDDIG